MQELTETYRGYSDDQITLMSGQIDSLTEAARSALLSEIRMRGLSVEKLSELRIQLAEHTASVDRERRDSRQAKVSGVLRRLIFRFLVWGIPIFLLYLIHRFWNP
jgi:hypothetical protein